MSHPLEVLRQVVTGSGGPFITEVTAVDASDMFDRKIAETGDYSPAYHVCDLPDCPYSWANR